MLEARAFRLYVHPVGPLARLFRGDSDELFRPRSPRGSASRVAADAASEQSYAGATDRIAALLTELEIGPAIVVAHSTGASMAFRLAYRHPGLVSAIVSLDGGPAGARHQPRLPPGDAVCALDQMAGGVGRVRSKIRESLVETSGDTSWVTEEVVDRYTAGPSADLAGILKAYLRMADSKETERLGPRLPTLRVPVRLVVGAASREGGIPDGQMTALTRGLASFAGDSVPGAGLHVHEERPDAVVEAIRRAGRGTSSP